ncbi:putative methylesterase 11, chloroplastic [Tanacetum coccineum]
MINAKKKEKKLTNVLVLLDGSKRDDDEKLEPNPLVTTTLNPTSPSSKVLTQIVLINSCVSIFSCDRVARVILVGHDFGGVRISYVMELFPSKIAKAIFIVASMLKSGQSTLHMFSQKENTNILMRQAQKFLYTNGNNLPPTAIDLNKMLLKDLLFNQSPGKDVALASVSMRPIPFPPVLEKLSLTDANYGSVRRFYIETPEDNTIPITLQQSVISESPPEKVFRLKGSDHSLFFPQNLRPYISY